MADFIIQKGDMPDFRVFAAQTDKARDWCVEVIGALADPVVYKTSVPEIKGMLEEAGFEVTEGDPA